MRASSGKLTSTPSSLEPLRVKLFSSAFVLPSPMPRAMLIRSAISAIHTAITLASNTGRRHQGSWRRYQATQLTKKTMCRPSSRITGSKVSTSSSGKKPVSLASLNRPKPKKLSMHSE